MNWKVRERARLWPNLRYYHGIYLERLRKTIKTVTISGLRARDFSQKPPE
jgi:hypothetical protein